MSEPMVVAPAVPPTDEWGRLVDDARRHAAARRVGVADHRPRVAVLACSDARVPPSVVFSRPAGELFVVRIAGNTASSTAVASLEYAVEALGVGLVVVLGHTGCGAVAAAIDGTCDGSLAPVVAPICALVAEHPHAGADDVSRLNVAATMRRLVTASRSIAAAVAAGGLEIRGAVYDLASGELAPVDGVDGGAVSRSDRETGPSDPIRPSRSPQSSRPDHSSRPAHSSRSARSGPSPQPSPSAQTTTSLQEAS